MKKQVAVLVGAGSIGQAIIRRVSAGKHIVLADYSEENAKRAAKTLEDAGFECSTIKCDLGSKKVVTKVWISNAGEEKAAKSIDESLRKLQTDYIDLLLIHQAYGDVFGSWRAMEKAYKAGKVRAIGVSNFQAARFFDFAHYVDVKPMVNQLQCNPMIQQTGIEPLLAETDTKMMAWGPLGGQGVDGIVKSELLAGIGQKYGKTAAQVALRWLTQRGIVAIPKSSHKERMEQNLNIFDFKLSSEEMAHIATMNQHDTGTINFQDPQFVKYLIETYG